MADGWGGLSVGALILWVVLGGVSLIVLWRSYLADRSYRRRHGMPSGFLSQTLAIGGTITYVAAAWAAFLTVRRLLNFDPIPWSTVVTVPLLLLALSLPIGAAAVLLYQRFRY